MKKILLLLFTSIQIFAQTFIWQNPLPQGNNLNSVRKIDSNKVFAVGNFGTFIKTNNGGEEWILKKTDITRNLLSIFPIDILNIWISGEGGTILHTIDGGETFTYSKTSDSADLNEICFIDQNNGFMVSANWHLYQTKDEGKTWKASKYNKSFSTISMYGNKGIAASEEGYYVLISNSGTTLVEKQLNTKETIKKVFYVSERVIYIAGTNGFLAKSNDGGNSFTKVNTGITKTFNDIYFRDEYSGILLGHEGTIYRTFNGGSSFDENTQPQNFNLSSLTNFTDSIGWIVGSKGLIVKSNDFGATFAFQNSNLRFHLKDIFFYNDSLGIAIGSEGKIIRTENGGIDWTLIPSPVYTTLNKINYTDSMIFVGGDYGRILASLDSGKTWSKIDSDYIHFHIKGLSIGPWSWIAGDNGNIRCTDSIPDWIRMMAPISNTLNDVETKENGLVAYIGGEDGIFLWSYNPEDGWFGYNVMKFGEPGIKDMFILEDRMWAVGKYGVVHVSDNGATITSSTEVNENILNSVCFVDTLNGYTVGSYGAFYKTKTSGRSWDKLDLKINNYLTKVYFLNNETGWILGSDGLIIKVIDKTNKRIITNSNNATIEDFNLMQNYPNPFNSSTIINFVLNKDQDVSLEIFDVMGRKIKSILDSKIMEAGAHSVNFSSGSLSSGTYFYRLKSAGNSITRKFIILK